MTTRGLVNSGTRQYGRDGIQHARTRAYERYRPPKFDDAAGIVLLEIIWRELRHTGSHEGACTTTRRTRREREGARKKGSPEKTRMEGTSLQGAARPGVGV